MTKAIQGTKTLVDCLKVVPFAIAAQSLTNLGQLVPSQVSLSPQLPSSPILPFLSSKPREWQSISFPLQSIFVNHSASSFHLLSFTPLHLFSCPSFPFLVFDLLQLVEKPSYLQSSPHPQGSPRKHSSATFSCSSFQFQISWPPRHPFLASWSHV